MTRRNGSVRRSTGALTPAKARKLLANMDINRPVRHQVLVALCSALRRGTLHSETLGPILIGTDGRMIDGQHRCLAVIETGVTIPDVDFKHGLVTAEVIHGIDRGAGRTPGNVLMYHGYKNANGLAASARVYAQIAAGQPSKSAGRRLAPETTLSDLDYLIEYVRKRAEIVKANEWSMKHFADIKGWLAPGVLAGTVAIAAKLIDEDLAYEFGDGVATGESLRKSSPIYKYRTRVQADAMQVGKHLAPKAKLFMLVRAWGYWITGSTLNRFLVGKAESLMPVVLGPDDAIAKLCHTPYERKLKMPSYSDQASKRKKRAAKK